MVSKKPAHIPEIELGHTAMCLTDKPGNITVAHLQGPASDPWKLPSYLFRLPLVPEAQISCLCGFPHRELDCPCSYCCLSLSSTYSPELSLVLAMGIWICLYHILDVGSMITVLVVNNLIILEAKSCTISTFASIIWSHPCEFLVIFLVLGVSLNLKCLPLFVFPLCLSQIDHPVPSHSHLHPFLYLQPAPSLPRSSPLFPLPKGIHVSLLGSAMLTNFSQAVDYSLFIPSVTSIIHLWVSTYHAFLCVTWLRKSFL